MIRSSHSLDGAIRAVAVAEKDPGNADHEREAADDHDGGVSVIDSRIALLSSAGWAI
jgi:hypothetical protein